MRYTRGVSGLMLAAVALGLAACASSKSSPDLAPLATLDARLVRIGRLPRAAKGGSLIAQRSNRSLLPPSAGSAAFFHPHRLTQAWNMRTHHSRC